MMPAKDWELAFLEAQLTYILILLGYRCVCRSGVVASIE